MATAKTKPVSAPKVDTTKGGPPLYNDFPAFQKAVNDYFDKCDEEGVFPDEAGMWVFLRIFEEDMERLYAKEDGPKYERVMKIAKLRRESWLSRNMVADNKMTTGCANALKEEKNGGYNKPKAGEQKRVRIVMPDGTDLSLFK